MSEYRCSVSSGGAPVNFISDVPLYGRFASAEYSRYFLDFECFNHEVDTLFSVRYKKGETFAVEYSAFSAEIVGPWNLTRNGETILYAAYPFMEMQHQRAGVVTAHAAAVCLNNQGILLLGKVGAGKTSTAYELCKRHGARLIGNDICLIGGDTKYAIHGGTKYLHVRLESARRNLPELVQLFPPRDDIDSWSYKLIFRPDEIGIETYNEAAPLNSVYLVHIDQEQQQLFVQRQDDLVLRLMLNENFTRYIRATTTTLFGGQRYGLLGYIPSLDTPEFYEKRRRFINFLLDSLGVIYVSGKLDEVVRFISESTNG